MQRSVLALLILAAPGFALAQADPHAGHPPPMPGMDMPGMAMAATPMGQAMTGALGAYPMAANHRAPPGSRTLRPRSASCARPATGC
jgi:hypothetical protein